MHKGQGKSCFLYFKLKYVLIFLLLWLQSTVIQFILNHHPSTPTHVKQNVRQIMKRYLTKKEEKVFLAYPHAMDLRKQFLDQSYGGIYNIWLHAAVRNVACLSRAHSPTNLLFRLHFKSFDNQENADCETQEAEMHIMKNHNEWNVSM